MDVSLSVRFTATERRERGAARRVLIDRGPAERALARRSMHGTLRHRSGALAARCRWNVIRSFIMKSGCRSCALAAASSSALGIKPPQDHPHIYLNMGDASEIGCPYCSTLFRFDPSLGAH